MKIFILEDDNLRIDQFKRNRIGSELTVTDQADEALEILAAREFDVIYLDHDLGGEVMVEADPDCNTGSRVAKHFHRCLINKDARIFIHSLNTPAAKSMKLQLERHGCTRVKLAPFAWKQ